MTQQVVKAVIKFVALDPTTDDPSFQLHFEATGTNESVDQASLSNACAGFINNTGGGGINAICKYLSTELMRGTGGITVELYDITAELAGGVTGPPIDVQSYNLSSAGGGNPLPSGIAAAFNYEADYGTDTEFGPGTRPRSRDRNRFYLGPLMDSCLVDDATTHRPKFTTQFISDVQKSLSDLSLLNATEPNQISLVVWSRRNAGIKHAMRCVADDRPDYQRRRSDPSPGTRVIHTLTD